MIAIGTRADSLGISYRRYDARTLARAVETARAQPTRSVSKKLGVYGEYTLVTLPDAVFETAGVTTVGALQYTVGAVSLTPGWKYKIKNVNVGKRADLSVWEHIRYGDSTYATIQEPLPTNVEIAVYAGRAVDFFTVFSSNIVGLTLNGVAVASLADLMSRRITAGDIDSSPPVTVSSANFDAHGPYAWKRLRRVATFGFRDDMQSEYEIDYDAQDEMLILIPLVVPNQNVNSAAPEELFNLADALLKSLSNQTWQIAVSLVVNFTMEQIPRARVRPAVRR